MAKMTADGMQSEELQDHLSLQSSQMFQSNILIPFSALA
jgi:hypothetical protein